MRADGRNDKRETDPPRARPLAVSLAAVNAKEEMVLGGGTVGGGSPEGSLEEDAVQTGKHLDGERRKQGVGGSPCPAPALPQRPGGGQVGVKLPEAPVAEGQCSLASGPVSSTRASQGGARA